MRDTAKKAFMEDDDACCPNCGSRGGIPILYGYPGKQAMAAARLGLVSLGGCILRDKLPNWHCDACGHERDRQHPPPIDWDRIARESHWLVVFWRRVVKFWRRA